MIYYVTGNSRKFEAAKRYFDPEGIELEQKVLDIPELQTDSIEEVALLKAKTAFEKLKHPLFVNDTGWYYPGLNGFPGPYAKYIHQWFTPQDFLNLLQDKDDRTVILRQVVVYIDDDQTKIFTHDAKGVVLKEIRGEGGVPADRVCSFDKNGLTISEAREKGVPHDFEGDLWKEFLSWLKTKS